MDETKVYEASEFQNEMISQVIREVSQILEERGYNPINQIVGYLISGDPGYISNYKDSRTKILDFDRAEVMAIILEEYIEK